MQIEKAQINDCLRVPTVSWKFYNPTIYNFAPVKFTIFLKVAYFLTQLLLSFLFLKKSSRLNNLKTITAMNVKIYVVVICVEAIINLLLYNLHDYL